MASKPKLHIIPKDKRFPKQYASPRFRRKAAPAQQALDDGVTSTGEDDENSSSKEEHESSAE